MSVDSEGEMSEMIKQLVLETAAGPPTDAQAERLAGNTLRALRLASTRGNERTSTFCQKLSEFFCQLCTDLSLAFMPLSSRSSMCQLYGHVIRARKWSGYYPCCHDCGARITSPAQLRVCNPRLQKKEDGQLVQVYKSRIKW